MFYRLRRAIGVIVSDVVYFTPVNAAAVVDGLNVGEDSPADESDGRGRPAERKYAADLDLGRRDTGVIGGQCGRSHRDSQRAPDLPCPEHCALLRFAGVRCQGGAVHRFYGRRQQRKLTTREPALNSPPSIGPQQSTVLFLNSSRLRVGDCHNKPTIVTVSTSTATQSRALSR